jgi:DNA processing protein
MAPPTGLDAETRDLLALRLVPGLGPRRIRALLDHFGSATRARLATFSDLRSLPHFGEKAAQEIAAGLQHVDLDAELQLLERHQVHLLRLRTPDYPPALATIDDPPPLLYVRGALDAADRNAVAIVGSRHCTPYGRRTAEHLGGDLARAGYTVVSGLARGIDAAAHRGALAAGGRTLAVLAGGLARIYPPEHQDLAEEVAAAGALLSESPMTLEPLAQLFPQRNRIVSGLSRGVVVVEAADKSGARITAKHALDQGREVFAVPGPVDSEASSGTLRLLKEGAILARHAEDILEVLGTTPSVSRTGEAEGGLATAVAAAPQPIQVPLTEQQQKVLNELTSEPVHADDLVQRSGLSVPEVSHALLLLELHGLVRRLPGNRFERR